MIATTSAIDGICAGLLGKDWKRSARRRGIAVDALRTAAARALATALRRLARGVAPGERFTLTSLSADIAHEFQTPRKAPL